MGLLENRIRVTCSEKDKRQNAPRTLIFQLPGSYCRSQRLPYDRVF
jgi:hypothetical protein